LDGPFPAYRGDQPYVFVCYAHDDAKTVYAELAWLKDQGVNLWYDEGISAGQIWRAEIARALDGATQVLYYVSSAALGSDHCNREINYALDKGFEVLPVYLEEVALTPDLEIGLSRVQALHRGEDGSYRVHLMDALGRLLDTTPATDHETREIARERRSAWVRPVAVALAVLAGVVFWLWPENRPIAPTESVLEETASVAVEPVATSIAVLPFVNLSGDPENEYFSDGVAEEILNVLSDVESLRVAARTSAFSFKGQSVEIKEIAEALNVAHVLEGSVRRGGEQVRIQVQLIDAATGFRMWSESFDRSLEDIFAVQDEIAVAVAGALKVELALATPAPGTTTENLEAYNALLRGRALITYADEDTARTAIRYFKRAVELDPDYGAAYGALALQYALISTMGPLTEVQSDWQAAFTRALQINPDDVNALVAKAYYVTVTEWNWKEASELYARALKQGIPASASILYGTGYLWALGRLPELWAAHEEALSTDPYNIDILWDYATYSTFDGEGEQALRLWDRIIAVLPDYDDAWVGKAHAYAVAGDADGARMALDRVDVRQMNPFQWQPYLLTLWLLDDKAAVQEYLAELERREAPEIRAALTWTYPLIGEIELALDGFEAAYRLREFAAVLARSPPPYRILRGHPRYEALLEKMNLDDASLREAGLL
jgi:adenylate cyclase